MPSFAGSFLVAKLTLRDPSFRRTVVLLLQHGPEGAFGLVVNRPAKAKGLPFQVFSGGPCEAQGLFMLHGHPDWVEAGPETDNQEVAPGIFLGDADAVQRANDAGTQEGLRFRLFLGYAGWGPGQLEQELAGGDWAVSPANGPLVFDTPPEDLWDHLAPPRIPEPSAN